MTGPRRETKQGERFPEGPTEANPTRQEQIDVLLALAGADRAVHPDTREPLRPRRILDAGCGGGSVAERLLAAHPAATLTGFDLSPESVEKAQRRLGDRARVICASFDEDWVGALKERDFDLIVCVQALHHVPDDLKRLTYRRFADVLRPGGLYLQSDPVALGDAALFPYLRALWNRLRSLHRYPPLPASYRVKDAERDYEKGGDLLASLDDQIAWLRQAGFANVDCFWKHGNRAIFGGVH